MHQSASLDFHGVDSENLDYDKKVNFITRIGNLETEKIELEEVLKKEVIKNEKLECMLELLKKINEEKLEGLGFLSY